MNLISSKPRLSFNLIYDLEAVVACLEILMGLALIHFQKYWLLISFHVTNTILNMFLKYTEMIFKKVS